MDELDCPIHYGACLLRGTLDPRNLPRVYVDFRNVGLQSLIEYEDVVHVWKVREFHHEFLMTGVNSPVTWGYDVRVSFALNQEPHNVSVPEFSALMGIPPAEDDYQFFTDTLKFTEANLDDGSEDLDEVLETIVKRSRISMCIKREKVMIEDIKDDLMIYYRVIRENVTCRDMFFRMNGQPNPDKVMVIEALMLFWILKGRRFDMGFIMASVIQGAQTVSPTAPLPYGMRLTHLFRRLNVMPSEEIDPAVTVPRKPLI
jgi:hypothetical protein